MRAHQGSRSAKRVGGNNVGNVYLVLKRLVLAAQYSGCDLPIADKCRLLVRGRGPVPDDRLCISSAGADHSFCAASTQTRRSFVPDPLKASSHHHTIAFSATTKFVSVQPRTLPPSRNSSHVRWLRRRLRFRLRRLRLRR